ncbi:MAG: hypothetical protein CSA72_00020 [Rhodobacterales bacterium]|nr:MAG: hypothetical protein CSA72_00020 [Rhodobacterales bacterium]
MGDPAPNLPGTSAPHFRRHWALNLAILCVYALTIYGAGFFFFDNWVGDLAGVYVTLTVPLSFGFTGQVVLDPYQRARRRDVYFPLAAVLAFIAIVLLLMEVETLVCLVIAVPFLLMLVPSGVILAQVVQRLVKKRFLPGTLYSTVLILPLLPLVLTPLVPLPAEIVTVRETVVIDAPARAIWEHTVNIAEIQPEERLWTFSHNLLRSPKARDAQVTGTTRHLRWTKGVRFREEITRAEPYRLLEWDFVFHDKDSLHGFDLHIDPDSETLTLLDGRYELIPLPDGRTQLVLESRYRLSTPVNRALKPWGAFFLGDFQRSVLHVIRLRVEGGRG